MHAPDGFLNAATALTTGALSAGAVGVALRQSREQLADKQVPLAGLAAAFIFAAQMVNFPVAGGTTGHLLGGGLAAILLGPWLGTLTVTVVVVVQALAFADGGLTALGYNVLNMAVVTSMGGYAAFRLLRKALPANGTGVVAATGLAAGISVVLSSLAFSVEWLFGATAPIPFPTVLGAMVGVHALIAVGEGLISAVVVGAVLATRGDLVAGAADLPRAARAQRSSVGLRGFVAGGVAATLLVAGGVSQLAVDQPDGLERVAAETGIAAEGEHHPLSSSVFADYATSGVDNEALSLALAGLAGSAVTLGVGTGMVLAVRDRRGGSAGVADA
jgi:cobalt/nickel transport system permease protein